MSDKKFTDEDIIKALELCKEGTFRSCKKCPFTGTCSEGEGLMEKNTLDLINRQKSEIETLKDFLTRKEDEAYERGYAEAESEQIEEIAKVIKSVPPIAFPAGSRMQGKHVYAINKLAEHLYNAGYRKQEWISVEDRLPEDGEWVLGYSAKSGKGGLCNCLKSYVREFGNYDDTTHWMPLPEFPNKKGE